MKEYISRSSGSISCSSGHPSSVYCFVLMRIAWRVWLQICSIYFSSDAHSEETINVVFEIILSVTRAVSHLFSCEEIGNYQICSWCMLGYTAEISQETQSRVHRAGAMPRSLLFMIGTTGLWSVMMKNLSNLIRYYFEEFSPHTTSKSFCSICEYLLSLNHCRVTMASGLYMPSCCCIIVPLMPQLHKYQYSACI